MESKASLTYNNKIGSTSLFKDAMRLSVVQFSKIENSANFIYGTNKWFL